jgi:predicted metalloprotease with PDZ domain
MNIQYFLTIDAPQTHLVQLKMRIPTQQKSQFEVYLPGWSPGSYLVRDYARHVCQFRVYNEKGEDVYFKQISKNKWQIDLNTSAFKVTANSLDICYSVYCYEIGVRNSYVDIHHAFLNGPSLFMAAAGMEKNKIELLVKFPAGWSKISTGLKDISIDRAVLKYGADNYDDFIDCPIEIGCHETDGFQVRGVDHSLAFFGSYNCDYQKLKQDMKTVTEVVASHFSGDLPYENYHYITHFAPGLYGGLEHKNSTALHFDGRKLSNRKDYLNWIALVAHEYFHTWNVKRIRPLELGPFNYDSENYTTMLWLAEGLTSFMDDLLVYRAGISTVEEYAEIIKGNLSSYLDNVGKKFHSLEESSFNAWVKLYKPDENSNNSSISYYLKGGLVFMLLHIELKKHGSSIDALLEKLWQHYLKNPNVGVTTPEIYQMVKELSNQEVMERFKFMVESRDDLNFEDSLSQAGIAMEWDKSPKAYLGHKYRFEGERVFISQVVMDSPSYRDGINANDEVIAIDFQRITRSDIEGLDNWLVINKPYQWTLSHMGKLHTLTVTASEAPRILKALKVNDSEKFKMMFARL